GLVALVLAAAAALAGSARATDPKFLPNDTEWALHINVKQILDSPLVKAQKEGLGAVREELEKKLAENPAGKFIKDSGFDLLKDLKAITIAGSAKEPDLIVVEGNFDVEKFVAAAEKAVETTGE